MFASRSLTRLTSVFGRGIGPQLSIASNDSGYNYLSRKDFFPQILMLGALAGIIQSKTMDQRDRNSFFILNRNNAMLKQVQKIEDHKNFGTNFKFYKSNNVQFAVASNPYRLK